MKKNSNSRNKIRIKSTPNFYTSTFSKSELINGEISSLKNLTKLIKFFQIEYLSNQKEDKDLYYNYTIENLLSLKNLLNDSLKKEYEEKNYLMLKVIIYLFLLE